METVAGMGLRWLGLFKAWQANPEPSISVAACHPAKQSAWQPKGKRWQGGGEEIGAVGEVEEEEVPYFNEA